MNIERLAWVDLETTGLEPHDDWILELGIIVTNSAFGEVARASWVFRELEPELLSTEVLARHTASGLIDECASSVLDEWEIERDALAFMREHGALGSPMCGASVHFDRAFLRDELPELHEAFHYRNFDVTTFRILSALRGEDLTKKRGVHRAIPDLEDAIDLARRALGAT